MKSGPTQGFIIRPAHLSDLPHIFKIRTSVRENHLSMQDLAERGVTPENTVARMEAHEFGAWVAVADTEIIAFAFVEKANGNLWALFTDPEHEGKGCGSALLLKCETWLKEQGLETAILDTAHNTIAAKFYAKRGWIEYDRDEHAIFMKKLL